MGDNLSAETVEVERDCTTGVAHFERTLGSKNPIYERVIDIENSNSFSTLVLPHNGSQSS